MNGFLLVAKMFARIEPRDLPHAPSEDLKDVEGLIEYLGGFKPLQDERDAGQDKYSLRIEMDHCSLLFVFDAKGVSVVFYDPQYELQDGIVFELIYGVESDDPALSINEGTYNYLREQPKILMFLGAICPGGDPMYLTMEIVKQVSSGQNPWDGGLGNRN